MNFLGSTPVFVTVKKYEYGKGGKTGHLRFEAPRLEISNISNNRLTCWLQICPTIQYTLNFWWVKIKLNFN